MQREKQGRMERLSAEWDGEIAWRAAQQTIADIAYQARGVWLLKTPDRPISM